MTTLTAPPAPDQAWRFTPRRRARYIELLTLGFGVTAAARQVGVSRNTVCYHREHTVGFREAEEEAREGYLDDLEGSLMRELLRDPLRSSRLTQFVLCNRRPEKWKPVGANVQITATAVAGTLDPASMSPSDLRAETLRLLSEVRAEHHDLTTPAIGPGGGVVLDTTGELIDPEPIILNPNLEGRPDDLVE